MKSVLTALIVLFCFSSCKQNEIKSINSSMALPLPTTVDPVTALKVASSAAKIIGFGFELGSEAKKRKKIKEMIDLLNKIDKDIQKVKLQNNEILKRLDELPFMLSSVLKEELKVNELNNRYKKIEAVKYLFMKDLNNTGKVVYIKPNSTEFKQLWNDLFFIIKHEYRIGSYVDILMYTDFASVITNQKMDPYTKSLLEEVSLKFLNTNLELVQKSIDINAENLKRVISSNRIYFDDNLGKIASLDDLKILPKANKPVKKTITVRSGRGGGDGGADPMEVPIPENIAFNNKKTKIYQELQNLIKNQYSVISDYKNVSKIRDTYMAYISSL